MGGDGGSTNEAATECYGGGYGGGDSGEDPDGFSQLSVMPLTSDGSLCMMEAFRRSSSEEWRYDQHSMAAAAEAGTNHDAGGPKLEDFLGGYAHSAAEDHHSDTTSSHASFNHRANYYQNSSSPAGINVNAPPTNATQIQLFHHYNDGQAMIPTSLYHVPIDGAGATSIAGFKSWLRQGQFPADKSTLPPSDVDKCSSFQSLTLSMSPSSSQPGDAAGGGLACMVRSPLVADGHRKRPVAKSLSRDPVPRKSIDTFGQRTSQYRGIGGREDMKRIYGTTAAEKKGKRGRAGKLSTYEKELEGMKNMTRQEFVAHLRRKSSGFSRGASVYRGVTRCWQNPALLLFSFSSCHTAPSAWKVASSNREGCRQQGLVLGHIHLCDSGTQEEAAEAYDIAAIKFRGVSAVTNFDISKYDVKRICSSTTLIAGDLAKRSPKESSTSDQDLTSTAQQAPALEIAVSHMHSSNASCIEEIPSRAWNSSIEHQQLVASSMKTNPSSSEQGGPPNESSGVHHQSNGDGEEKLAAMYDVHGYGGSGGDFTQSFFFAASLAPKYENVKGGSSDGESGMMSSDCAGAPGNWMHMAAARPPMPVVHHQLPMFALWNE
ncbi:hypothetical protein ACLOJK_034776 [Asimina triloba]